MLIVLCFSKLKYLLMLILKYCFSLQCPFLDVSCPDESGDQRFDVASLVTALQSLVESIQRRAGLLQIYHTLPEQAINPDIR